jgi:hypothetical protein
MSMLVSRPCSHRYLRGIALKFREDLGFRDVIWFPIVECLDLISTINLEFTYEIVEDEELPYGIHAVTDVVNKVIRIKQSVYDGACCGNKRDRMTIAHEIAHYLLFCVYGFEIKEAGMSQSVQSFRDPEWQAKCLAGEILVAR